MLTACSTPNLPKGEDPEKSKLTSGQVSLTLRKNQTTQAEVAEVFGAPNLVTNNSDGEEVWIYQKHATIQNASSASVAGGFGGIATIFLGGIGGTASTSTNEQSSRTMTLIIKFKDVQGAKRVVDFSSRYSSF